MAASKTIMNAFTNCANDMKREIIQDIIKTLESNDLLTDDIKDTLTIMLDTIKVNKKLKKPPQKRFSGYHLFMKGHRVVVKEQNPNIKPQELTTIVSKAWKDVSEDEKEALNERAMQMKKDYMESTTPVSESESEGEVIVQEAKIVKKEKKVKETVSEKKVKSTKKDKKKPPPPPEDSDSYDEIEDATSDIEM